MIEGLNYPTSVIFDTNELNIFALGY